MKKTSLYLTLVPALISTICIFSCGKDDPPPQDCPPDLPCATQYGANTFGCYIDGVPWVAKVEPYILDPSSHPLEVSYDETGYAGFNNNSTKIKSFYHGEDYNFFAILFNPLKGSGNVQFNHLADFRVQFRYLQRSYFIDTTFSHNIFISKLDTLNRVLSGTFFFTVANSDDTIKITDGRFDVKYSPE